MPRKSLGQILDVENDFVRPPSMTLTAEDLRVLPSTKGKLVEPAVMRKSIQKKLASVGILKVRRPCIIRSNPANSDNINPTHCMATPEQPKSHHVKQPLNTLPKSQLLKPPLLSRLPPTPKLPYSGNASIASAYDISSFSPNVSRGTIPSPALEASISSPEYTNSEPYTSGDEFSDISSPVASLVLGKNAPHPSFERRKLRGAVIRPQIFEYSSDNDSETSRD
ncbi:uncharacterized protein ZBIST_0484 [Zygosaccharomyces bailii]|nr:uncharacterized protein ZBAI_06298 [Zygosaccharomyces bailii ISA1307]SJM82424.1 uncharacterized protein ZBIST_0484 [Zygosaccharomyces bailii]